METERYFSDFLNLFGVIPYSALNTLEKYDISEKPHLPAISFTVSVVVMSKFFAFLIRMRLRYFTGEIFVTSMNLLRI